MSATDAIVIPCPRCEQPLIDPLGLGWCKACGYCHSLAETDRKTGQHAETASKPNQLTATSAAIGQAPLWVWVTLIGMAAVIGGTWAAGHYLRFTPLSRAVLTTVQTLAGVAILLVVQFVALMKIAPEDSSLTFKDAVFPFRLYGLIFKRLPAMSFAVFVAVWCLTAIISVNIFVGGLGHWLTYLPDSKKLNTGPKGVLGK
jgi:hypothetical protein